MTSERSPEAYKYCPYCGVEYAEADRANFGQLRCSKCPNIVYFSPITSVVAVCPVFDDGDFYGLLSTTRAIPPIGETALPGGFMDYQEDWRDALRREVYEETGLKLNGVLEHRKTLSTPRNHTLIYVDVADGVELKDVDFDFTCDEVSAVGVIKQAVPMAFPSQTLVVDEFFRQRFQAKRREYTDKIIPRRRTTT